MRQRSENGVDTVMASMDVGQEWCILGSAETQHKGFEITQHETCRRFKQMM